MPARALPAAGGRAVSWAAVTALVLSALAMAAGAHAVGAGHLPGAGGLLALTTVLACASYLIVRSRARGVALLGCVGGLQIVAHLAFTTLALPHGTAAAAGSLATGHSGHLSPWIGAAPQVTAEPGSPGWVMVLAHLVAALVTTKVVGDLERALGDLWVRWAPRHHLPTTTALVLPLRPRPAVGYLFLLPICTTVVLEHVRRRGPPRPAAVAGHAGGGLV